VVLINTCSVRDQAEQKALGKMGMVRRRRVPLVTGFMGCMAQSRGAELLDTKVDLVVGTQKYHRVVEYVEKVIRAKEAQQMDDERFSIVDIEEETASQNTIRDHQLEGPSGLGVRQHHAGLQHEVHVLHCALHAWR